MYYNEAARIKRRTSCLGKSLTNGDARRCCPGCNGELTPPHTKCKFWGLIFGWEANNFYFLFEFSANICGFVHRRNDPWKFSWKSPRWASQLFFYYFWKIRKLPSSYRLLNRLVPLTKNHLAKKQWNGSKTYCYCDSEKTNEHLFLSCPCTKNRFVPYLLYLQYFSTHQYQKHFRNSLNGTDKKN
jgi:hypothetical protein